ncbi:MAG TPA: sigma-70 family RNA polymerase sigma factor [Gaiellales bacterium]|jgi:RNA polymerase sigma-B factor|nr:sigma-70 family RNA polymerase sigma factor [Gaiellales bacterium]
MTTVAHRSDIELARACQDGDATGREALIMRHAGLVRAIARRYSGRGLSYDDIVQSGYLGLIQAVDRYDPGRGVPIRVYAARTIEGEIMHLFRDRGWAIRVPRSLQEMSRRMAGLNERLSHRLGRTPSVEELAEASGEDQERVTEALWAQRAYTAESLADPSAENGDDRGGDDRLLVFEDRGFDAALDRDTLARAIRRLPARERTIVALRFFDDLTQSEIAARLGISQMHVSRLLRASLDRLRAEIGDERVA